MQRIRNWLRLAWIIVFLACSCTPTSGEATPTGNIAIEHKSSTSTSITVAWSHDFKISDNTYKISLYNRNNSRYPRQEYTLELGESTPRAFTFSHLDARSSYNVQISTTNGLSSEMTPISTLASEKMVEGDIFLQNFNELCWGYDYINQACGVKIQQVPSSYNPSTIDDTIAKWAVATSVANEEKLFKYTNMLKLFGISEWYHKDNGDIYQNVYQRPGYVKLGTSSSIGALRTPKATLLPISGRDVVVEFKACPFTLSETVGEKNVIVNLIDNDGKVIDSHTLTIPEAETMPSWSVVTTSFDKMNNGESIEIISTEGTPVCIDDIHIYYPIQIEGEDVYGYVVDNYNRPIKDVVVSDGFSVTTTNEEGYYKITPIMDTYHIFISVPSEYKIPINNYGQPCFFQRYDKNKRQYDFLLTRLNSVETRFALFGFGDPQVSSNTGYKRFTQEAVPKIKAYAQTFNIPVYGITAGDVVSVTNSSVATPFMPKMRDGFAESRIGFPVFQVMGNHDNVHFNANKIIEPDETSSTFNLKAQRDFEKYFGPANYSFNRGKVHIIGMRDIIYSKNNDSSSYSKGFTKEQFKWLEQDLMHVPKDMMVILVVHIPLLNASYNNIPQTHQLLKQFNEAHIISGHTHIHRNYEYTTYNVYEHNVGAVCGAWWSSCICGDGTPNGYEVFIINGNKMEKWYHMGYPDGMDDPNNQLRLYRGNAVIGGDIVGDNPNETMGRYAFNYADNVILANIFDADSKWVVSVYENGVETGKMKWLNSSTHITGLKKSDLVGSFTEADPRRAPDGKVNSHDFWAHGFQMGVLGRGIDTNASFSTCYNMFMYELKDKTAEVKVVAKDRFGNTYECSHFSNSDDYRYAAKPAL